MILLLLFITNLVSTLIITCIFVSLIREPELSLIKLVNKNVDKKSTQSTFQVLINLSNKSWIKQKALSNALSRFKN